MSIYMARAMAWSQQTKPSTARATNREEAVRGRGNGLFDRANESDRKDWNSDDEEFDEYGRRKKKRARNMPRNTENATAADVPTGPPARFDPDAEVARFMECLQDPNMQAAACESTAWSAFPSNSQASFLPHGFGANHVFSQAFSSHAPAVSSVAPPPTLAQTGIVIHSDMNRAQLKKPVNLEEIHSRLPCKFFLDGHCKDGTQCAYRHVTVTSESRNTVGLKAKRYCNFYGAGKCLKGIKCPYIHGTEEVVEKPESIENLAREFTVDFVDFVTGKPQSELPA